MQNSNSPDILFTAEEQTVASLPVAASESAAWPVLVVDDDEEVHIMTRLVLGKLRYKNRPLELLTAYSAREAEEILRQRRDLAVALVDIVMETDDAGLRLARCIREDFGNEDIRIVLRTGQPGQAPVRDVILNYDINDYKSKTELTSEKLFITIITALRGFDNIRSVRAAESANRLKSSFLATMSHEIRTPMNGVLGMLELLSHSSLSSDQKEMLQAARLSAGTLLRIIDDILDFSKIEAGRMDIERQPLDFGAILESVAETVAPAAHRKGVAVHVQVGPGIPALLQGDPVRLRQILFNLAGNAIKFTEAGHVRIRAAAVPGAAAGSVRVRVDVQDTGIGIAGSVQSKLFQPFTQAELSTSRRFGGTGLGLSITRRLIDLMHGEIGLESRLGHGSTFWFWVDFPLCGEPEDEALALSGIRVDLRVQDLLLAETVEAYLRAAGAEIAAGGAAGEAVIVLDSAECLDGLSPGALPVLITEPDARPILPDGVQALARPLKRSSLIKAVASAARPSSSAEDGTHREGGEPEGTVLPPLQGQLILVAEDQMVNQMVIRRQLSLLGLECEVFDDGITALTAWRSGRFAVVLTDCNMPEMDGFALTEAIRREEAGTGRHTPVIALTANAIAGEDQRCLAAGMDGYLPKPINLGQLQSCLRGYLQPVGVAGSPVAPA